MLGWLLAWWLNKNVEKIEAEEKAIQEDKPSLREIYFSDSLPAANKPDPGEPVVAPTGLSREDILKAASAAGISFSGKQNDLEIIEGIGPKIAELLSDNGIRTFAELSKMSVENINAILEQGGERFKLANPSTWAEQALLAAENRWQELKTLQDELDGGLR